MASQDITGRKFNRWTVIGQAPKDSAKYGTQRLWHCRCDCGNESIVPTAYLVYGNSKSCGCFHREKVAAIHTTHGLSNSSEYRIWHNIRKRCYVSSDPGFHNYGARGISMCPRWLEDFRSFYADMGARPSPKHSIERIDNNGNYDPYNCKWATRLEQNNNSRRNRFMEHNGKRQTVAQWSRDTGVPSRVIITKLNRGISPEEILT
jgi:hypothetical protein